MTTFQRIANTPIRMKTEQVKYSRLRMMSEMCLCATWNVPSTSSGIKVPTKTCPMLRV